LRFDIVFVVIRVNEMEFSREMDIGFVKWDEEKREDLVNFDEEYLRLLVEFYVFHISIAADGDGGKGLRRHTITFDIEIDARRKNLVPAIDHPDDPSRVDFSNKWQRDVREAGNSAEWVNESCIREEVCLEGVSLVRRRPLRKEVNNMRNLSF
jgi:hypothetical protein